MTAAERLRLEVDLLVQALPAPGRLLVEHPRARELFPRYLATGYHLGRSFVPVMEAALERARELAADDRVAAGLVPYFERHIPEEMHGDEPGAGTLDDLAALGLDPVAVRAELAPPKIAALVGAQYFWIRHYHPVAVLGFIQLEAFHPDASSVDRLIEATGLPREGFRQLLLHATLDVGHVRDLHRVLDSLPLEPFHEELIGVSAVQSVELAAGSLLDVLEPAGAA